VQEDCASFKRSDRIAFMMPGQSFSARSAQSLRNDWKRQERNYYFCTEYNDITEVEKGER